jgi:N-acyl-D-aspartate/D-glutamate deacylase
MREASLALLGILLASSAGAQDLTILNGRVMDPETGLDALRHVAVRDGRITAIASEPLPVAGEVIDAAGLVVAPGFIDLHAHGQDAPSNRFQAADGVTTALALELGVHPVAKWYASREGQALIHYGATVGHFVARYSALEDQPGEAVVLAPAAMAAASARRAATPQELERTLALLEDGLIEGALGIGVGVTYTPGATHEELFEVFRAAARLGAPIFVHVRAAARMGGDYLAPIQEIVADAAASGASAHIVHLNSSTDEEARPALALIRAAHERGVDVTTESYP